MCWFEVLATARSHSCEIYGGVLGGMQFGVLVQVSFEPRASCLRDWRPGAGHAVWQVLMLLEVLVMVRARFCEIDGRVLLGVLEGILRD